MCDPISLEDWKATLKVAASIPAPDVTRRIRAGTRLVEKYIRKCIVAQVWDMFLDDQPHAWPALLADWRTNSILYYDYSIELRKPPLLSVNGVYVRDDCGQETQVDPSTFWVSDDGVPGRIALKEGCVWPYHRCLMGFRVRMTCGYVYPFTCSGGVITTYPAHGFVGGQSVRIQLCQSDNLPDGLEEETDYSVTNVTANTLQLMDGSGQLIQPADTQPDEYNFIGVDVIPETIRRAIVLTSAIELGSDVPNKIQGQGRYAPVTMPITAADLLESERFYSI